MARIFINFRNFDGDWAALAIRNTLVERFGANEIFLSSFSIRPGEDFAAQLLSHASECDVLLAVIGPRWLTVTGPDGKPRLGAADDWVCREIDTALANGRTVVPIILSGADRLREADLPPQIAGLHRRSSCPGWTGRGTPPTWARSGTPLMELMPGLTPGTVRRSRDRSGRRDQGWKTKRGDIGRWQLPVRRRPEGPVRDRS